MSRMRSPDLGPGALVKPKSKGGLFDVGELVPLSTHCAAPAQNPNSVACALPGIAKTPTNVRAPANAEVVVAPIFITVPREL